MASRNTIKKADKSAQKYAKNLKKLKTLGIAPKIHANKRNFTANEKRQISRLYNRFDREADFATTPKAYKRGRKSTYTAKTVKSRADRKLLKAQGYAVYKDQVLIKHEPGQRVSIKSQRTIVTGKRSVLTIQISDKHITRKIIVEDTKHILATLKDFQNTRLPMGVRLTVKIGENKPFDLAGSAGMSYKDLLKYISNWQPKDMQRYIDKGVMTKIEAQQFRADLINEMTLVTIR